MFKQNPHLKKVKFLSELPLAEADELSKMSELRAYSNGQTVFTQGSKLPGIFVVSKGALKSFRSIGKDKVQVLDIIKPGQCIGELQVFSDGTAASNAEAKGDTKCWLVPTTLLRQIILRNPIVAEVMLRHLAAKLCHLIPLVETLSLYNVPERVAQLILSYHSETPDSNIVEFRETQEELAQYIGASREAFNRALRQLSDIGLIQTTYPVIHINNIQRLVDYIKSHGHNHGHGHAHDNDHVHDNEHGHS